MYSSCEYEYEHFIESNALKAFVIFVLKDNGVNNRIVLSHMPPVFTFFSAVLKMSFADVFIILFLQYRTQSRMIYCIWALWYFAFFLLRIVLTSPGLGTLVINIFFFTISLLLCIENFSVLHCSFFCV